MDDLLSAANEVAKFLAAGDTNSDDLLRRISCLWDNAKSNSEPRRFWQGLSLLWPQYSQSAMKIINRARALSEAMWWKLHGAVHHMAQHCEETESVVLILSQLGLYAAQVHAASGSWEQAQAVLQPAVDKAQDAVEAEIEEEESEFTNALEDVLFQLVSLSLQAAWHLQHPVIASDMYTLCTQISENSQPEDKASRLQHLVALHLKYVSRAVDGHCSVLHLQQSWGLLQQSAALIGCDLAAQACSQQWMMNAKTDVATLKMLALVIAVHHRQQHGELAIDVASASELAEQLAQMLPQSSSLRASGPCIIKLMDAECLNLDAAALCSLLGEQWMSAQLFAACLSHIMGRVGLGLYVQPLKQALDQHPDHASVLSSSLEHLQVDTDADVDALCDLLESDSVCDALTHSHHVQQHVFHLLHSQGKRMLGGQCKDRLSRVLRACSRCCTCADSPLLHHTMCIAALQDGRLDEALHAVAALQQDTADSGMHERGDAEGAAAGEGGRQSQHLSACLLRLKIETMAGDVEAAQATLELLCSHDISAEILKIVAKDILQSAEKEVAQAVLTCMLRLCSEATHGSMLQAAGPELPAQLAAVLAQLLTVPSTRPEGAGAGQPADEPVPGVSGARTAAEALESILESEICWNHLDESSMPATASLMMLCETMATSARSKDGEHRWPSNVLEVLATSSIHMAKHANERKWSRHAVTLYRCAAALWFALDRMTVDDLRYASEAFLKAAQIAVDVAHQEANASKEMVGVASDMLHKACTAFDQLQQSMFFVANDLDRCLAMDREQCRLQIALLQQDVGAVHLAMQQILSGGCPEALWRAAAILPTGDHGDHRRHALKAGFAMVLKGSQGSALQKKVAGADVAAASVLMYEACTSDAERLQALKLVARVLGRKEGVEGDCPADVAHWLCAKAYNAATSRMRAREHKQAEAFMEEATRLCDSTHCAAVTAEMCRDTAKKFCRPAAQQCAN